MTSFLLSYGTTCEKIGYNIYGQAACSVVLIKFWIYLHDFKEAQIRDFAGQVRYCKDFRGGKSVRVRGAGARRKSLCDGVNVNAYEGCD